MCFRPATVKNVCLKCGAENIPGAKVCFQCAAELSGSSGAAKPFIPQAGAPAQPAADAPKAPTTPAPQTHPDGAEKPAPR